MPSIAPTIGSPLNRVGIENPEGLRAVGAEEAWLRIRLQVDEGAWLHQLQALAGAVAGIPKQALASEGNAFFRANSGR